LACAAVSLAMPRLLLAQVVPVGTEFQVNTYTTSQQRFAAVAANAVGNFVVVWTSYTQDGTADGVFGQRYASSGAAQGGEFQVNTTRRTSRPTRRRQSMQRGTSS
jgi:hypothetical protein